LAVAARNPDLLRGADANHQNLAYTKELGLED